MYGDWDVTPEGVTCEVQPSTCYTFQLDEVLDHISQGYKDVWTAIWQQIRPFSKAKFRKTSVDSSLLFLIQVCIFFVISIKLMLWSVHWNIPPISVIYWFLSECHALVLRLVPTKCPNFGLYWPLVDYFVITISTTTPPKYHMFSGSHHRCPHVTEQVSQMTEKVSPVTLVLSHVCTCDMGRRTCDDSAL